MVDTSYIKQKNVITGQVKGRCIKRITHKYGIELPKSTSYSESLDKGNDNSFWDGELAKEMFNVGVAVEISEDSECTPVDLSKAI